MGSYYFLLGLLLIAFIAKNNSLIISVGVLLVIKLLGLGGKAFPLLETKGINLGIILITIAVLTPIATGEIGLKQLYLSLKSPIAWVALISGIAVALLAKHGVGVLSSDPQITVALAFGTILAVVLFKGVAVGPLIAAGIVYLLMKIINLF